MMKNIVTIGGSTSKNSINKQLAEYAGGLLKHVVLTKVDLNDYKMPLYSVDLESEQGFSEAAKDLNEVFSKADGFIVSLAEHNGAYSAAFKNAFDWLSRQEVKVWRDKPMLLLSTSPGPRGAQTVLEIALAKFPYMGANIIGSLSVPSFYDTYKEGAIVNENIKSILEDLMVKYKRAL